MCLPTWRRAGKRFQGRGVPPPVVYLVVGESRAGSWAGGGRSSNACMPNLAQSPRCAQWRGSRERVAFKPHPHSISCRSLFESKLNLEPAVGQLEQAGRCRAFVGLYTGFSASVLSARKEHHPSAAGAAPHALRSAHGLVHDVVGARLSSDGRPRRCRSCGRQIGVLRSCTPRRRRLARGSSSALGRPS